MLHLVPRASGPQNHGHRDRTLQLTIAQTLLPEFDQEMATSRRLLERVPTDKGRM